MISTQTSLLMRLRYRDDAEAWSRFVRLYTPIVYQWVNRLGFEKNTADDIVQEIFVVLVQNADFLSTTPPNSFRGWLRTVTLNKARDRARRQNRASQPALLQNIETAIDDPNEKLLESEYRESLAHSALKLMRDAFSETTWRAVWEHVAQGRPARDVAEELGISENAVYLARGRVFKRIRQELDGLWD